MSNTVMVIEYCVCKRCEYGWWPKSEKSEVKICPRCKSPNWNKNRKNRQGLKDGNETSIHKLREQELSGRKE